MLRAHPQCSRCPGVDARRLSVLIPPATAPPPYASCESLPQQPLHPASPVNPLSRQHASIVGIYCSVQPVVTVVVSQLVIVFTPPPHMGLEGASIADLGAVGIFAGLALTFYAGRAERLTGAARAKLVEPVEPVLNLEEALLR